MYLRSMSTSHAPADLFFDLDRTLWDFDRNSREALEEIFLEIAQPNLPEHKAAAEFIPVYEAENEKCWKAYREGRITKEELRLRFRKAMDRLGYRPSMEWKHWLRPWVQLMLSGPLTARPFLMGPSMCRSLKARGHRMFILTNGFEEAAHQSQPKRTRTLFRRGVHERCLGFKSRILSASPRAWPCRFTC